MAGMAGYGLIWLEMAANCWKWDGLITVLWIWLVWDMTIRGLGIKGVLRGSTLASRPWFVPLGPFSIVNPPMSLEGRMCFPTFSTFPTIYIFSCFFYFPTFYTFATFHTFTSFSTFPTFLAFPTFPTFPGLIWSGPVRFFLLFFYNFFSWIFLDFFFEFLRCFFFFICQKTKKSKKQKKVRSWPV